MAQYDIVALAKQYLFEAQTVLSSSTLPVAAVEHVLRLKDMYAWYLAHPEEPDRVFVDTDISRHKVGKSTAYRDLSVLRTIIPHLSETSREFHRWRFNEMILETYKMAKLRKDTKTMEKAASSYAKFNRVDVEDEQEFPFDKIAVQPFTATSDPTVLGITPIPNLRELIKKKLKQYLDETLDIQDVDFEEVDVQEAELFGEEETDADIIE